MTAIAAVDAQEHLLMSAVWLIRNDVALLSVQVLNRQRHIHPPPQRTSRRFDLIEAGGVS